MPVLAADVIWNAFRKTPLIFALLIGAASSHLATASAQSGLDSQRREKVEASVSAFMSRVDAPALSIAIVDESSIVFEEGYGFADLENYGPAKTGTVYPTASLAKPITAVAVMQLVEKGKIDLDAPIQRYVPAYPTKTGTVTVRDLLRHTAGVRHQKRGEFGARTCHKLPQALDIFAADPLEHRPGERFRYSNYGYILLGVAVERVSGMDFAKYLRVNIFEPAGMRHTSEDDPYAIIRNRADGYTKTKAGELRKADWVDTRCWIPAGGLVSTVGDFARFVLALQDGKLLKPDTVRDMMTSHLPDDVRQRTLSALDLPPHTWPHGIGLGWAIGTGGRRTAVHHAGDQAGVTTMLYLVPEQQTAIVLMTNLQGRGGAITSLADEIAQILSRSDGKEESKP